MAPRPVVSRVARPAAEARPPRHLQLVKPNVARAAAAGAAERLADATGGAVEQGEGGLSTVHFPPPATTPQPYTISRELTDEHVQPANPAPATAPTPPASANANATPNPNQPALDKEALYEYFLDRFKRDLLVEREQLGHLIIDNP
ncbi:MAG TPA: hypothetical protein VNS09_25610 [Solirubrobacter sp.]|nr:hypothetical protein [Solirubrobacter sp.]